jgi:hypothetical protein
MSTFAYTKNAMANLDSQTIKDFLDIATTTNLTRQQEMEQCTASFIDSVSSLKIQ